MPVGDSKTCTRCGEAKPLSEYYLRDGKPIAACKVCTKQNVAAYQKANRDKVNAWQRANRNPERDLARYTAWRRGPGREKFLATKRRYRERHAEKLKQEWADWYAVNGEKRRAKVNAAYDPEKKRAERTPERSRIDRERRRARMLAAYIEDTPFDVILQRDLGVCGICHQQITSDRIDLDHIIPLAAGGMHELNNVQLAHPVCNKRKGVRANYTLTDAA